MHWVSKVVEATVGPQRGEQTSKHEYNIVRKQLVWGHETGGWSEAKCAGECVGPNEARGGGNVLLTG